MENKQTANTSSRVFKSSLKLAGATLISRILGLVREQVQAAVFGASGLTDAFNVAYRIPNMLRDLFAEGAFSPAFVPVFVEAKNEGFKVARRLLWSVFLLLLVLTIIIGILMVIFANGIVANIAPKFLEDPNKFQITVTLLRIMSPFLSLVSVAALFMGALNAIKIFFVPALAPASYNVIMILAIFCLPPFFEKQGVSGIYALGFGAVVGGLMQILVQIPLIIRKSLGPLGPVKIISPYTKKIAGRMGLAFVGVSASQVNIFINTLLATGTVVGAVSWLTYAFRLFQFPLGILGVSIGGSNLVHFSDAWKGGKREEALDLLKSSYLLSLFTISWALVMLYTMSVPTAHLIFERGAFSRSDTLAVSELLKYYLWCLPCYGLFKIFSPTFYSIDRPQVPVFISLFSIFVNIVVCLTFVPHYGYQILAMGVSISIIVNTLLQIIFLTRYLDLPKMFFLDLKLLKILLAVVVAGTLTHFLTLNYFNFEAGFIRKMSIFVAIGCLGSLGYFLILFLTGEGKSLRKMIKRK
ncbi:MAG: murein biosynthesis integral membrane protein MurJ [Bdellovibrionales bacterium RIFOXYB1_FULL_37_110]|nr:MAG: murein biosynthesis integral membrane protein MurJ [Bdellovibrionales bacterium RIFOXYA1_FULL_38_20]OFZ51583.1 MAG: murein biosynthesis integral membrane protein MurJ [Bdellovibrionales bacterium RIFOXYC1_FULL_37_79]OFZ60410.1 MAG: murein biosynthesis integral membrane protein MurJ [Bdellovibrionales bacterium RIFOXYB1_FULL_37_110]OFZ64983.1 MAG: murein biosynthesis integral membrane protein MurJ [Bdellovibrionales bacterium RIFOXYD1_FULL_36_51]